MESPVFEEIEPADDCDCPGCAHWRNVLPHSRTGRFPGHPARHRTAVVVAAVTSAAIGATAAPVIAAPHAEQPAGPDVLAGEDPGTPQGVRAPLYGPGGQAGPPASPEPCPRGPARTPAEIKDRGPPRVAPKLPGHSFPGSRQAIET